MLLHGLLFEPFADELVLTRSPNVGCKSNRKIRHQHPKAEHRQFSPAQVVIRHLERATRLMDVFGLVEIVRGRVLDAFFPILRLPDKSVSI